MTRIDGVDPEAEDLSPEIKRAFAAQRERWGAPLLPHLVYARRPSIYRGARGMWGGLAASGLLDPGFAALVNLRVASLNGCVF